MALVCGIAVFLFWPVKQQVAQNAQQISALQADVKVTEQSVLANILPADMKKQITDLRQQAQTVQTTVKQVGQQVDALTREGWMAALIPEAYGGAGLSMAEASVIMEEINRSGGNSGACHGQMYVMNAIVRGGSEEQKQKYLPRIASGELRRLEHEGEVFYLRRLHREG